MIRTIGFVLFISCSIIAFGEDDLSDLFIEADETITDDTSNSNDDLDTLFDNGDETLNSRDSENDEINNSNKDSESLASELISSNEPVLSANVDLKLGGVVGITEYSTKVFSEDWSSYVDVSPLGDMDVSLGLKLKPSSNVNFYTELAYSLDYHSFVFDDLEVTYTYLDYILAESISFRIGKQPLSWGDAKIVSNNSNFVENVEDGMTFKAFIPTGTNGITLFAHTSENLWNQLSYKKLAGGFSWIESIDPFVLGLNVYVENVNPEAYLYIKSNIFDFDVISEIVYKAGYDDVKGLFDATYSLFVSGKYEHEDFYILLENLTVSDNLFTITNESAFGYYSKKAWFAGLKPGFSWKHQISDSSGTVTPLLRGTILPDLKFSIALPVRYGEDLSYDIPDEVFMAASLVCFFEISIKERY